MARARISRGITALALVAVTFAAAAGHARAASSGAASSQGSPAGIRATRLRSGDIVTCDADHGIERRNLRQDFILPPFLAPRDPDSSDASDGSSTDSGSNSGNAKNSQPAKSDSGKGGSGKDGNGKDTQAASPGSNWVLSNYRQFYLQLPEGVSYDREAAIVKQLEGLRTLTVGFVPENSWHVLVPSDNIDGVRSAVGDARLVPILARHKVSPEWRTIKKLLEDDWARKRLVAGATVSSIMKDRKEALTHYIGALQIDNTTGTNPRVHVRVWFPHLTDKDASVLGLPKASDLSPGASVAEAWASALSGVIAASGPDGKGNSQQSAPEGGDIFAADSAKDGEVQGTVQQLVEMLSKEAAAADGGKGAPIAPASPAIEHKRSLADGAPGAKGNGKPGNATFSGGRMFGGPIARGNVSVAKGTDDCAPVVAVGSFTMDVLICIQHAAPVLRWLAEQPMVYWLAPRMQHTWENLAAGAVTQGSPAVAQVESPKGALPGALHPVWEAGIRGEGQIVGIGDSGVDMDSCYFYDPNVPFADNVRTTEDGTSVFLSKTHRKVAMYYGFADTVDAVGHGSHTAGSIAGSRYDSSDPDLATGIAPSARLAIIDLSRGNRGYVVAPDDLSDGYFQPGYDAGARIHSDSWGSDVIVYDYSCATLDRWLWENQDFVSVFAAGNYGSQEGLRTTVTSPATAKNAISVGATVAIGMMREEGESTSAQVHSLTINVAVSGVAAQTLKYRAVKAAFGGEVLRGKPLPLAVASPEDGCSAVAAVPAGSLMLVRRGGCYFSAKLENAAAAGAAGVILTNDKQEGYFQMESDEDEAGLAQAGIFMVGVPLSTGRNIWNLLANTTGTTLTATFGAPPRGLPAYENLASFSSYGPTQDGRIKPDVVAPGQLISVASDGVLSGSPDECAVKRAQGTSMATPVVAGSVALIRQYFVDGFYPTGAKVPANTVKPSGPLMKAALLGGAINMLGNTEAGLPLEPAPSFKQGFGRVNLTRALPLKDSGWRMQVVDMAPMTQGDVHRYCVTAVGGPLSITLAWYDYPGSPASSGSMLVNNLDLEVRAAGLAGALLRGNGFPDDLNTVERVMSEDFPAGNVQISVLARRIPAVIGTQKYALVVQGRFSGVLASKYNPAPEGAAAAPLASDGACVMTAPVIDAVRSPRSVVKDRTTEVHFGSKTGIPPSGGFQCRLEGKAVAGDAAASEAAAAGHDWRKCASPAQYSLPDGVYTFKVRADGEEAFDTLTFTVDATPPAVTLTSSLPAADNGGRAVSAAGNATFQFSAKDASPVTYECLLAYTPAPGGPKAPAAAVRATYGPNSKHYERMQGVPSGAAAPPIGSWAPCASPLTLWGLTYGDWGLSVRATDSAGNQGQSVTSQWATRYEAGRPYARAARGSYGLVNSRNLAFGLDALAGADGGAPSAKGALPLEWTVLALPDGADAAPQLPAGAEWTKGSDAAVQVEGDGRYLLLARPEGSDAAADAAGWPEDWAVMPVTVDTAPPRVNITARPPPLQSSPVATVRFGSAPTGDADAFACRWLSSDKRAPDPAAAEPPFGPCVPPPGVTAANPLPAGTGAAAANVTEGYWLFQVKGTDAAGNEAAPVDVAFRTDLSAPRLVDISYPNATNAGFVTVAFSLDDGPLGSGVANVSCRMTAAPASAAPGAGGAGEAGVAGSPPAPAGARATNGQWGACKSPVSFLLPRDGRYTFQLLAHDAAHLQLGPKDFSVVRDTSAPTMRIMTAPPPPGVKLPRRVEISLVGKDSLSGVVASEGLLRRYNEGQQAVKNPAALGDGAGGGRGGNGNTLQSAPADATGNDFAVGGAAAAAGPAVSHPLRRLLADAAAAAPAAAGGERLGKAYVQGGNAPVILDAWVRSDDPSKFVLEDLPSGSYSLSARGVDAAGNVGPATDPIRFSVDASLLLPEEAEAQRRRTIRLAVGLGLGFGGALLLVAGALAAYHWRRSSVARRVAREREAAARRAQWEQWGPAAFGGPTGGSAAGAAAAGRNPSSPHYAPHPWHEGRIVSPAVAPARGGPAPFTAHDSSLGWAALGWRAPGASSGAAAADGPAPGAAAGPAGRAAEVDQALLDVLARRDEEDARLRAAIAASREEEQLKKAIAASLAEGGNAGGRGGAPPRGSRGDNSSMADAVVDVSVPDWGAAPQAPPAPQQPQQPRGWFSRRRG